jgi:DNA repair protein RecN (Recombination protein N)
MGKIVFSIEVNERLDNGKPFFGRTERRSTVLISTNLGEPLKSLSRIASGGELSRIMLAMKNVLAENDEVGTLIFDEVDSGSAGERLKG